MATSLEDARSIALREVQSIEDKRAIMETTPDTYEGPCAVSMIGSA